MALEADIGRGGDAGLMDTVFELHIGLEGIEGAVGRAVLIGQVEEQMVVAVAQSAGDAVGVVPVDVVGC